MKHAALSDYLAGFGLSLVLTGAAFLLVSRHVFNRPGAILALSLLAILQLFVQVTFFLNLDREKSPRLNLLTAIFAVIVVVIVVGGSLWIMSNLNYHMTPTEIQQYLNSQDGL